MLLNIVIVILILSVVSVVSAVLLACCKGASMSDEQGAKDLEEYERGKAEAE